MIIIKLENTVSTKWLSSTSESFFKFNFIQKAPSFSMFRKLSKNIKVATLLLCKLLDNRAHRSYFHEEMGKTVLFLQNFLQHWLLNTLFTVNNFIGPL